MVLNLDDMNDLRYVVEHRRAVEAHAKRQIRHWNHGAKCGDHLCEQGRKKAGSILMALLRFVAEADDEDMAWIRELR